MSSDSDNRYLHLIRQDCLLPPGTHIVDYYRECDASNYFKEWARKKRMTS